MESKSHEKLSRKRSRKISYETLHIEKNIPLARLTEKLFPIIDCFFKPDFKRHMRTFKEICDMTGFSKSTVSRWLRFLKEKGWIIERIKRGKRGNPKFYFLKLSSPYDFFIESPVRKPSRKKTEKTLVWLRDGRKIWYKKTISSKKPGFSITSIDVEKS